MKIRTSADVDYQRRVERMVLSAYPEARFVHAVIDLEQRHVSVSIGVTAGAVVSGRKVEIQHYVKQRVPNSSIIWLDGTSRGDADEAKDEGPQQAAV